MDFINGVIMIKELTSLTWYGMIIPFVPAAIVLVVIFTLHIKDKENLNIEGMCAISSIIFMVITLNVFPDKLFFTEPSGEYEVVITEEVDMAEFNAAYEIVDYEDGVYTIKLRQDLEGE